MPTRPTETVAPVTDRQFGVEIEFVGIQPDVAIRAIQASGSLCSGQFNYTHTDSASHWKIVPDGSVCHPNGSGELVSPILSGLAGLQEVARAVGALEEAGAKVNRSCGLHVHVNARDFSVAERIAVLRRYAQFETDIDQMMPASRRGNANTYCQGVSSYVSYTNIHHFARHLKVNLTAFDRHGTVEFRQHAGTVNSTKINNWIRFCVNFAEQSRSRATYLVPAGTVSQHVMPAMRLTNRNAGSVFPVGRTMLRRYDAIVGALGNTHMTAARLAREVGVSEASVVVLISHLRTRYGFQIRKAHWSGAYYMQRQGILPTAPIRGGRRGIAQRNNAATTVVANSNTPAPAAPDTLYAGLDSNTTAYLESRREDLAA